MSGHIGLREDARTGRRLARRIAALFPQRGAVETCVAIAERRVRRAHHRQLGAWDGRSPD